MTRDLTDPSGVHVVTTCTLCLDVIVITTVGHPRREDVIGRHTANHRQVRQPWEIDRPPKNKP